MREIQRRAAALLHRVRIKVPYDKGQLLSRIYGQGKVLAEEYEDDGTLLTVLMDNIALERISRELPAGSVQLLGAQG